MDTNIYWAVRGAYAEKKKALSEKDREWLESAILDTRYNNFLSQRADLEDNENDVRGHGKRLPYIGWFWRHIQFSNPKYIPIGDCGEFIGFMENNKWDYPQRCLTAEEFEKVIAMIDEAMQISEGGGDMGKNFQSVNSKFDELWKYMQTLKVK